jgi:hypothetical protein
MRVGTQRLPLPEELELPVLDYIDFHREASRPVLQCARSTGRNVGRPFSPTDAIVRVLTGHEKSEIIQPICVCLAKLFKISALIPVCSFQVCAAWVRTGILKRRAAP